jgi:TP901 family phage tail tape measure protein
MGFMGQLFATRIAIGLAVPSPQALAKSGGMLARGISSIHSQVQQAKRAQAGTLGEYQAELNNLNKATLSTTQKLNNEINVGLKRTLNKMDAETNKSLSRTFNRTEKGYNKLKNVLSAPLSNELMKGVNFKGMDGMVQQTQNLYDMGKANRQEVLSAQDSIVMAAERRLQLANEEMAKFPVVNEQNQKEATAAADELVASKKELDQQVEIRDNLRLMNREIDTKVGALKRAAKASQEWTASLLSTADTIRYKFNSALRSSVMILTAVGYKLQQNVGDLMEFERELLNANSVFNLTNSELFDVGQSLTEFGNEFGIATQNASAGLYQLASAGVTANEAMEILPHTLKLSMAVQGDHNTISKLTAQTLFGFGMEMDQAAEVTDKFAYAIQKSLIEYQDLSSAVKFALPFFTSTGQSIDQLLGALQILTNRALEAGIAGRGLRQALAEFAESAMDAEVGFRKMGVEILNAQGEMLQLNEIAAQFAEAVGPNTASNTELLTTLIEDLNVRGATAFIHLVQASDEFTQAVKDTEEAGGQLDEMVKIQNASLTAQVQILKNNIASIFAFRDAAYEGTEFLNGFHEAVHNIVNGFKDQIIVTKDGKQQLTEFGQEIQEIATGSLYAFADMFEKFLDAMKGIAQHSDTFITLFEALARFLGMLADVIDYMANTNVPFLNKSLLEVYGTLKLMSMLGIWSLLGRIPGIAGGVMKLGQWGLKAAGLRLGGASVANMAASSLKGTRLAIAGSGRGYLARTAIGGAAKLGMGAAMGTGIGAAVYGGLWAVDKYTGVDVPLVGDGYAGGGYITPRAGGGVAGGAHLVGEQGPEIFIPGQAGQVLNNAETNNMLGKGVVFRNANISVDSFGGLAL